MAAVDWRVRALGVDVAVSLPGLRGTPGFLDQLRCDWSWSATQPSDPEVDEAWTEVSATVPAAGRDQASSAVTFAAIMAQAGRLWMLHAACVADPGTGRAVAFVGPSGIGKTTAALALGRVFAYVSDETTAVDGTGRVWPHPKPLSVVRPATAWKEQVPPAAAGLLESSGSVQLAGLVLLKRNRAALRPVSRALPTGEAMVRLAEHSSCLAMLPDPLQVIAAHIERTGPVMEVEYARASSLVNVTRQLLGARS